MVIYEFSRPLQPAILPLNHTQLFSQLSAAFMRHKANDTVVYAVWKWFKYDTATLEWYKLVQRTRLPIPAVRYLVHIKLSPSRKIRHFIELCYKR